MSEKIGMGAGTGKNNTFFTEIVYQDPVIFNMTFGKTAVIARKRMFFAAFGQWFFPYYFYEEIKNFLGVNVTSFR